jgi:DNA-directed RNA polymerase specialized sigma24 family protein
MARSGTDDSDDELLLRVAMGDDDAFAHFYRRHLDGVLAFLRRRVAQPELAFDLAAETFAAVILAAPDRRGDGEPAAWLYGIARNKLRESLRRGRVEDAARGTPRASRAGAGASRGVAGFWRSAPRWSSAAGRWPRRRWWKWARPPQTRRCPSRRRPSARAWRPASRGSCPCVSPTRSAARLGRCGPSPPAAAVSVSRSVKCSTDASAGCCPAPAAACSCAARSVTHVDDAGRDGATMRIDGAHGGAYLFVVRTNLAPYVKGERAQRATSEVLQREVVRLRAAGLSKSEALAKAMANVGRRTRSTARGPRITRPRDGVRATFAGGVVLRVAGTGRWSGPLPGVTRAPPSPVRPGPDVRAPLQVARRGTGATTSYVVRFRAPRTITRADQHYTLTVTGRAGPRCDRPTPGGGKATTRDLRRGAPVSFTITPNFTGWNRTTWCPGRHVLRVGYSSGSGPFRGRLVGSYAFTVPRGS